MPVLFFYESPSLHVSIFSDVSSRLRHEPRIPDEIMRVRATRGDSQTFSLLISPGKKKLLSYCASVWEHFHTVFTLMGNWNWLGRRTWPSWGLEQSACVSKQTHKLHSSELWVTARRLAQPVSERGCIISASLELPKVLVKHSGNTILAIRLWPPSRGVASCSSSSWGLVMCVCVCTVGAISWHFALPSVCSLFMLVSYL